MSRSRMARKNWIKNFDRKSNLRLSFSVTLLRSALMSLIKEEKNAVNHTVNCPFPKDV